MAIRLHAPTTTLGSTVHRLWAITVALALLAVVWTSPPASAVPALTATSTTTTTAMANGVTPLSGVTVGGLTDTDTIEVTVNTTVGTLAVSVTSGLDLAFGNNWSGDPSITFTGTRDDINAALATLELTAGSAAGQTATIGVTALVSEAGYVYSPSNQHFYEYVPSTGITWTAARTAAAQRTFLGQQGYLATIPSAEINDLISTRIEGAINVWFGGESTDTPASPAGSVKRVWKWVDGPLAGTIFSNCTNITAACNLTPPVSAYQSWAPGEPNNCCYRTSGGQVVAQSGEPVPVTNWRGSVGRWNDLPYNAGVDGVSGYVVEYGDQVNGATNFPGVVKASSAVSIVAVPGAPTGVVAQRDNGQAQISFTAPDDDGGSTITGYTVTSSPGGIAVTCPGSPCVVPGLSNGTSYTFTVVATNANGDSPPSAPSNAVIPADRPGVPTGVSATGGDESATISFTAPEDNGSAILGYRVTSSPGGAVVVCPGSPCVLRGLTNGTTYSFVVEAINDVGGSLPSDPSNQTIVRTVPDAPTGVEAVRGPNAATVSFTAPDDDGGAAVTGYTVTSAPGGITATCSASPCVVTGLINGTDYTFTVTANNVVGASADSSPSEAVRPATVPGAPGDLEVTRGDGEAQLLFVAPDDDGGEEITSYQVSIDGGDTWTTLVVDSEGSLRAGTVGGLTNGTAYDIRVRARNAVGAGEAVTDDPVTPAGEPGEPTGIAAARGDRRAIVTWAEPSANGSPITAYEVYVVEQDRTVSCPAQPCVVTGLSNGQRYTFRVRAQNDVGWSPLSEDSARATPATTPSAPTLTSVVSANRAVVVTFDAPSADGGDAIVGYEISTDGGQTWGPLTTAGTGPLTGTLTGLDNGTEYDIAVRAVNTVGGSVSSAVIASTPATAPGAVSNIRVTVLDGRATVRWDAPERDGGSPIVEYGVYAEPGGVFCLNTTTSCVFADLPAGLTYTFFVAASNQTDGRTGTGIGAWAESDAVVVTARPTAPQNLSVTAGDRKLTLRFTPPVSDGGRAITRYQVSVDGGPFRTVKTKGSANLRATLTGVDNGVQYSIRVRAVNANGAGPGTSGVTVQTTAWFSDPKSSSERAEEIPVPSDPDSYRGPIRRTEADYRSRNGTIAVPASSLNGRQLQAGQAANLVNLFRFDSATLTKKGRAQVKELAGSLDYVTKVTCEGYADYGGSVSREKKLSTARAKTVCAAIKKYAEQVTSRKVVSYGHTRPVVVGGDSSDRAANRRVVVLIRG